MWEGEYAFMILWEYSIIILKVLAKYNWNDTWHTIWMHLKSINTWDQIRMKLQKILDIKLNLNWIIDWIFHILMQSIEFIKT